VSNRHQVSVGGTTYTIEDREAGTPHYVKLCRYKSPVGDQPSEFDRLFVPTSLIVEYVLARLAPRLHSLLKELVLNEDPNG
jgi:hypothetical protein